MPESEYRRLMNTLRPAGRKKLRAAVRKTLKTKLPVRITATKKKGHK